MLSAHRDDGAVMRSQLTGNRRSRAPVPVRAPVPPHAAPVSIEPLLRPGAVRSAYQPIVDLRSGCTAAFEALARFDPRTGFDNPGQAFSVAEAEGEEAARRLDHACIRAAILGAIDARLPSSTTLFVNVRPATLERATPAELEAVIDAARAQLRVVVEVTELDVLERPAELLAFVQRNRARGFGLAVDDVGVNPDSLSLLPLLRPDVIKLDRSVLNTRPDLAPLRPASGVRGANLHAEDPVRHDWNVIVFGPHFAAA